MTPPAPADSLDLSSEKPATPFPNVPVAFWASGAGKIAISSLIAGAFFVLLRATPDLPGGYDSYRHARMAARLLRDPQAVFADPWRLAYFWPKPVDPWFGYHALLAPLTTAFDPIVAIKLLTALLFGGIAWVSFALLGFFEVRRQTPWVLLVMMGSGVTLLRATTARPFLLSVLLTLAAALFTLQGQWAKLALVSALHAVSYSIFFMVGFAPGLWLLLRRDRRSAGTAAACGAGIGLGLVLNPYFPQNIRFDVIQSLVPGIARHAHVLIGGELQPMNSWWWLASSLPVAIVWIAALVECIRSRGGLQSPGKRLLLAASCAAFAGAFFVGRTLDFFVPFAVLFAAVVLSGATPRWQRMAMPFGVLCAVLCGAYVYLTGRYVLSAPRLDRFRGAAEYLRTQAPGELVLNADWDNYYFLYYLNPANRYVVGIEPTMMYLSDPGKYWLWRHLSDDEATTCPREHCAGAQRVSAAAAAGILGARYIFTEHASRPKLEAGLQDSPGVSRVYRDPVYSIYRVAAR